MVGLVVGDGSHGENIVGISPSAFVKQAADPNLPRVPRKREKRQLKTETPEET